MVVGVADLWGRSVAISSAAPSVTAWSPCSHFIATKTRDAVRIRDALTFDLIWTLRLTEDTSQLTGALAYSPDGRSLACASDTDILIWDVQTGLETQKIRCDEPHDVSLVWSSDGGQIHTVSWERMTHTSTVCGYNVAAGTALHPITLQSQQKPYVWAHDKKFRAMRTARDGEAYTIYILEVFPSPITIKSFSFQLGDHNHQIISFSPTTYRISASILGNGNRLLILDVRNGERLLDEEGEFHSHCFSPDGGLFAASRLDSVHIWKYDADHYAPWGNFPTLAGPSTDLRFSPNSSSIFGNFEHVLKIWSLDGPSVPPTPHSKQLGVFSHSGSYIATAYRQESTVSTANPLSPTPSQLIDTGIEVFELGLTMNVLLVVGSEVVVAWLLTEEGLVNDIFGSRRASPGDSIWTVATPQYKPGSLRFSVEGETGAISCDGNVLHVYNTRTGDVLKPAQESLQLGRHWYSLLDRIQARRYLYDDPARGDPPEDDWKPSSTTLKEGWIKDREGKHLLWLPIEWRATDWNEVEWFPDIATIQFVSPHLGSIIAKLY